jgi:hypothetical protein
MLLYGKALAAAKKKDSTLSTRAKQERSTKHSHGHGIPKAPVAAFVRAVLVYASIQIRFEELIALAADQRLGILKATIDAMIDSSVLKSFYEKCFASENSFEPMSQGDNSLVGYDDRDTTRSQNTTVPASTLAEGIASPTFNATQDDSPASMSTASSDLVLSPVEQQATASVQTAHDFVDHFEATHPRKQAMRDLFTEIVRCLACMMMNDNIRGIQFNILKSSGTGGTTRDRNRVLQIENLPQGQKTQTNQGTR